MWEGPDWIDCNDAAFERLAGDLAATEVHVSSVLLRQFVETLERPPSPLHAAILSTSLLLVCDRVMASVHELSASPACACAAVTWRHVRALTRWRDRDPRDAFIDWVDAFYAHVEREHPRPAAVRAAELVRRHPTKSWTLRELARDLDTPPARLRHDFQSRFGLRLAAYVHLVRATRAIRLFETPAKVTAIAWEIGYRSKKDLYAALARWVGTTPTALRALSDDEREWLERELRIRCLRGVSQPTGVFDALARSDKPEIPR